MRTLFAIGLEHARDQIHQSRFSAASAPDKRYGLARLDCQVDVPKNRFAVDTITKGQIAKFDAPDDWRLRLTPGASAMAGLIVAMACMRFQLAVPR